MLISLDTVKERGDEAVTGRYGLKERNGGADSGGLFVKRMDLAAVNTYLKNMEEHLVPLRVEGDVQRLIIIIYCARRGNLKKWGS